MSKLDEQEAKVTALEAAAAAAMAETEQLRQHEAELERQITKLIGVNS